MDQNISEFHIGSYVVQELLGSGSQSNVYLCSKNSHKYAVKAYFPNQQKYYEKQVQVLKKVECKYIIKLIEPLSGVSAVLPQNDDDYVNAIVMEFAEAQNLSWYIHEDNKTPLSICCRIFKKLLEVIQYLDSLGISHRDLKPENILFTQSKQVKIVDFGLSSDFKEESGEKTLFEKLGTIGYRPPEMELGKYYGLDSDLFAAGVIFFKLYTGRMPFESTKPTDSLYKQIRQKNFMKFWQFHQSSKYEDYFPSQLKQLFNSIFAANPKDRPSLNELKHNSWFCSKAATEQEAREYFKKVHYNLLMGQEKVQKVVTKQETKEELIREI